MTEQQAERPKGSGWLKKGGGGGGYRPSNVLNFDKNETHIVRIMDKATPIEVWRHTARTIEGRFTLAFCRGDFDNIMDKCPLCLVNTSEKYRDLKGKDRPFPKGSEHVKAVWSYTHNKPMLLVGNEIWTSIDGILAKGVDIFKYDIAISRTDAQNAKTSYGASILPDRTAFDVVVDPATIPSAETYVQWLRDNLSKISITVPANVGAGGALGRDEGKLAGFAAANTAAPATTPAPAPATQVPASQATPQMLGGLTEKRTADKARFGVLLRDGWKAPLIQKIMEVINGQRKAISESAPLANNTEELTDDEYASFVDMYAAGGPK